MEWRGLSKGVYHIYGKISLYLSWQTQKEGVYCAHLLKDADIRSPTMNCESPTAIAVTKGK